MNEPTSIVAIGIVAADNRVHVSEVRKAAQSLSIRPVLRLNNIDHYSSRDAERIGAALRGDTPSGL